ncbi:hypothetical protein BJV74DRAFT_765382 [Russula compacta]|nr:hypothetical protein BJV74DRAFT_765382 [Russula compacta]
MSSHHQQPSEQLYSIQPHPAKTNDPADLAGDPQSGRGLTSQAGVGVFNAREPHIPSKDILDNVEQPKSREELRARAAELNNGK